MSDDEQFIPMSNITNGEMLLNITYGTPKTGLWCDTCNLPSLVEVPVMILGESGPSVVGTVNQCDGCGLEPF